MKNITEHTGKLEIIQRLPSSTNGNPRYLLRIGGITCRTAVDCQLGYEVSNFDGKEVIATIGTHFNYSTICSIKEVTK